MTDEELKALLTRLERTVCFASTAKEWPNNELLDAYKAIEHLMRERDKARKAAPKEDAEEVSCLVREMEALAASVGMKFVPDPVKVAAVRRAIRARKGER